MGVSDLWNILSELCERKPLTYLAGKYVAVDLSGWVVEAMSCKGLNSTKNPHLRNLFFRVSRLLQFGVNPVFVIEGKPPLLKEAALKARNQDHFSGYNNSGTIARPVFDEILRQCQDLLSCLGIPCIKSSGEAEAFCAFLCLKGVVSGVITQDSDAFLYGADIIYRDFSIKENDSHVNVYCLKSEKNKLRLNREKLVALALLLGCDYSKGVPGIGEVTAVNLISELSCEDVLQRFKDWKNLSMSEVFPGLADDSVKRSAHCNRCGHLGSVSKHKKGGCPTCNSEITCYLASSNNPCSCQWHVMEEYKQKRKTEWKIYNSVKKNCPDFPNEKVIEEYLNFSDTIPNDKDLNWNCPSLASFQEKALNHFGWTFEYSREKVLPLITAWQQYKLRINPFDKTNFICDPVEILKEHNLREITYYDVQWKVIKENNNYLNLPAENFITKEYGDQFNACYKEVVEKYYCTLAEKKEKREVNRKPKKLKAGDQNRKVKSKSSLHDIDICDQHVTSSQTPNDSFNGLLDMPLWERINLVPKLLLEDYKKSPVSDIVPSTNETFNLLLNGSDFSEVFSPMPETFSNTSLKLKYGENFKQTLSLSVNDKNPNVNKIHHLDLKHSFCLNFNDSDNSFLSILLSQDQKNMFNENFDQDNIAAKNEMLIIHNPSELATNSSKQNIYNSKTECLKKFCSPAGESPRLLYSVNQSTSTPKNICYNRVFSPVFNGSSTPLFKDEILAKDSNLSTPKSSRLLSNIIYSPLMFDSSIDNV